MLLGAIVPVPATPNNTPLLMLGQSSVRVQVLYQHLSQPCIDLDWSPEGGSCRLTDAIRHSLSTPGALLHTRCQASPLPCPAPGILQLRLI